MLSWSCHLTAVQAIQSWGEEFKVQLAAGGHDEADEEEGSDEGDDDDAAEAQALLDFAEAVEHRCCAALLPWPSHSFLSLQR
jgi:uncharacterized protein YecA (UPF0149 family)